MSTAKSTSQPVLTSKIRQTPARNDLGGPHIYNKYGQRSGQNTELPRGPTVNNVVSKNRFIRTKPVNF